MRGAPPYIAFAAPTHLYYTSPPPRAQTTLGDVEAAFATLGGAGPERALPRERLVEALTTLGEAMDAEELAEAARLLTGERDVARALPASLTPEAFTHDLLGFPAAA